MKNIFKVILIIIPIVCVFFFSFVRADSEQELIDLARISNILNAVYPLINDAQKQGLKNTRIRFRYDWLRADIQAIQTGIAQKINLKKIEPRTVKPLKLQYIERRNGHK